MNKMKRYKLLKDTPTIKAGTIFEEIISDFDELKELVRITPTGAKTVPQWTIKDINDFNEWFEEIKESVDSIHWKPEFGDIYWSLGISGIVQKRKWSPLSDDLVQFDLGSHEIGNCYRTDEETEHAKELQIARTKIRRSSDFVPDWNDGGQTKWYVSYDYSKNRLFACQNYCANNGAIAYYKTVEDTERAIKDLAPEFLLHFGVER